MLNLYLGGKIHNFMCFRIQSFPEESLHYKEIDDIMRAVQSSSSLFDDADGDVVSVGTAAATLAPVAGEAAFLTELFYALPKGDSLLQELLICTEAKAI